MFSRRQSETVIFVKDTEKSRAFYRDVVGLTPDENAPQTNGWNWFWTGEPGKSSWLAMRERYAKSPVVSGQDLFDGNHPWGAVHFAFEVPRTEIEAAVAHVRSKGHEVLGPMRLEWMKADAYYFYDPDGNLLEWWTPDPA